MEDPRVSQIANQLRMQATRLEIAATMPPSKMRKLRFEAIRSELRHLDEIIASLADPEEGKT